MTPACGRALVGNVVLGVTVEAVKIPREIRRRTEEGNMSEQSDHLEWD